MINWTKTVAAEQPEDDYQGYLTEHGYASNTPVTDGKNVFVFLGKTGVLAFTLDGEELWPIDPGARHLSDWPCVLFAPLKP